MGAVLRRDGVAAAPDTDPVGDVHHPEDDESRGEGRRRADGRKRRCSRAARRPACWRWAPRRSRRRFRSSSSCTSGTSFRT
jgi:hypothetical protein